MEDPGSIIVDGDRLLMVAMELVMCLFGLLFAFPHVPSRLIDNTKGETTWFSVVTIRALQMALLNMVRSSPVIQTCLAEQNRPLKSLTMDTLSRPGDLDEALGLNLYHDDTPITCQQMYHGVCSIYESIQSPRFDMEGVTITREWLAKLFADQNLMSPAATGKQGQDHSALISFCAERTVAWMQPYFASNPLFFHPQGLTSVCA